MDESSVQVAVRIRPRIPRELIDGCQVCTTVTPGEPQIWMGNLGFTFDHVLDSDVAQEDVFGVVRGLVDGCLEGYNATILAYGQTGSGKTYTMGTGFDTEHGAFCEISPSQGIVPRAVHHLFDEIVRKRQDALSRNESPPEFTVKAQFVELHNEEINDLISSDLKHYASLNNYCASTPNASSALHATGRTEINSCSSSTPCTSRSLSDASRNTFSSIPIVYRQGKSCVKIREDPSGMISMLGIETKVINSALEAMTCLRDGALVRSTASTNMNDSSSRSHAIFTLHIYQQRIVKPDERDDDSASNGTEFETLSAKFHFVDLAGSERLKRTGAVGERAKEGISINCGLLALGNVISALGDRSKKASHVPYRVSKLTRLLQDSLGGNSRTIMIACISPCDRDFVETSNTLKYANRARNIKNKVTINQDKSSRIISNLKEEIVRLELELQAYRQGKFNAGSGELESDLLQENRMLTAELEKLRSRVKALQETLDIITAKNVEMIAGKACEALVSSPDGSSDPGQFIREYVKDIEELKAKLFESEAMCKLLQRKHKSTVALLNQSLSPRLNVPMTSRPGTVYNDLEANTSLEMESATDIITMAQSEIMDHESQKLKLKKELKKRRTEMGMTMSVAETEENGHVESPESLVSSDVGDGDSGSDGDSEEDEMDDGSVQEEIANINDQINTKQRLIEQLELSNKRALDTKEQYEQQIHILMTKIKHTEEERDKVLNNLKPSVPTTAKIKQIKDEYEAKLNDIQRELTRMKDALKEHNVLVRKNSATEKQVATLKSEVDSMKRLKVKLQNQLKDENSKFREKEAKRLKEILQLKKEQRKKDVQIRALESKDRVKDQVLKRKLEEVSALKKQNKSAMSRRAAGKVASVTIHKRSSPAKGKKKWDELKSAFTKGDADRKMLEQLESEMLTHITNRKQLNEEIEQIQCQIDSGDLSAEEINRLNDEIDTLMASVNYSDEKVSQNQRAICDITWANPKSMEQVPDISLAMDHFTKEDCEYLMQKMFAFTMENVDEYKESVKKLSLSEIENKSLTRELLTANELLSHMFSKYCANDPNLSPDLTLRINNVRASNRNRTTANLNHGSDQGIVALENDSNGQSLGNSERETETDMEVPSESTSGTRSYPDSPVSTGRRFVRRQIPVGDDRFSGKARRLTSSRKELMGDLVSVSVPVSSVLPVVEDDVFVRPAPVTGAAPLFRSNSTRTAVVARHQRVDRRNTFVINDPAPVVVSGTDSMNNVTVVIPPKPNGVGRKVNTKASRAPSSAPNSDIYQPPMDNFNADTTFLADSAANGSISAPGSPGGSRRTVGNENVFQRLTSSTSGPNVETVITQGSIRGVRDKASQKSPFLLTHIAEGHAKAILDVYATENRLFTSGKDTTVKIWDLKEMREITTLTGTPTNISRVKYSEELNLLFCATSCYVRIYDLRTNGCIKNLSSAGISSLNDPSHEHFFHHPHKEQAILAIAVCEGANSLYTSYGQSVRLWDMRCFSSIGVLTGRHESKVMCMESQSGRGINTLVTGSKDHCIKVYTYNSNEPIMNIAVAPKATLNPPHYDGIESFALSGSTLFSGSRDNCIKKWDLSAKPEFVLAYNNAHGSWISGLCLPYSHPQYLVSSSRDGTMKLWSTDKSRVLGQVEAHKGGVNCLASNSSCIFTGSNEEGTVALWKLRNLSESSGESSPVLGSPEGST